MSHSSFSSAERARLAERLRERASYAAVKDVLEGRRQSLAVQQFEILVAACELFDGRPVLSELTEDHLAVVLRLAELYEERPQELAERLDALARDLACQQFDDFDERLRALCPDRPVPEPLRPASAAKAAWKASATSRTRTVELAELFGWGLALALLLAVLGGAVISSSLNDPFASERTSLKPVLELTTSPSSVPSAKPVQSGFGAAAGAQPAADVALLDELPAEQPAPPSGSVLLFSSAERVAPLMIEAAAGRDYLLRLRDWRSGELLMTVFVRGSQVAEIDVPAGEYRLRYAAGTRWYGHERRFGPAETCYEMPDKFTFRERKRAERYVLKLGDPSQASHLVREISRGQL